MEAWISLAAVLVGAVVTGIVTYVNVRSRKDAELRLTEEGRLRELRLPHYQRLFEQSGVIADRREDASDDWRSQPEVVLETLEAWYFIEGAGMFLTPAARDRYFRLIRALHTSVDLPPLTDPQAHQVCALATRLRRQLTEDVAVGRAPEPQLPAAEAPAAS